MSVVVDGEDLLVWDSKLYPKGGDHYEYNLIYVINWLYKSLDTITRVDDFPHAVTGANAAELIAEVRKREPEDYDEIDEAYSDWCEKMSLWEIHHSWGVDASGSILPSVYFRRAGDTIEISWDNSFSGTPIYYLSIAGAVYVDISKFTETVNSCIRAFLNDVQQTYTPTEAERSRYPVLELLGPSPSL